MSKKKDNKLDDDFDLDGALDFDFDSDFDEPKVKNDRKPITRAAVGAAKGAKNAVLSASFLKQAIKDTLPDGFGQSVDMGDEVGQSLKKLYDESLKEAKPAVAQAKKLATRIVPSDSKRVPKSVRALLDKWKNEAVEEAVGQAEESRESAMNSTLQDIFAEQTRQTQAAQATADAQDKLKQGVAEIRFKTMFEAVNTAALGISRLDQYQTNVTLKFQKRSLELQYRQLFAMQDLAKTIVEDAGKRDQWLAAIAKNTALPEFVKIQDAEQRKQIFKNKLFESMADGLYGKRNRYIQETLEGLSKKVVGGVKDFAAGITGMGDQLEMANDMTSGFGIDKASMVGEMAGEFGARGLGQKLGAWGKKKLVGSKLDERLGLSKRGTRLQRKLNNLPNTLNEFRNRQDYMFGDTMKDMVLSWGQALLPSLGVDTQATRITAKDLDKPYQFTRRTERSITEVIPGYLAHIHRELLVLRTGNNKIEPMKFDHEKGRFTSADKLKKSILAGVVDKRRQGMLKRDLSDLMKQIDPEGKLDPQARASLQRRLLQNSSLTNLGDEDRLADARNYTGSEETRNAVGGHMRDFFSGLSEDDRLTFERRHNRLASSLGDPRQFIQTQMDLGNHRELYALGLVDKRTGQINLDRVQELYLKFPSEMKQIAESRNPTATEKVFKRMADKVGSAGEAAYQGAKDAFGKATQAARSAGAQVSTLVQTGMSSDQYKAVEAQMRAKYDDLSKLVTDVRVAGEESPRIRAVLLEAGKYRDAATGGIIKTVGDIKGAVIDEEGNLVITPKEVAQLTYNNAVTKAPVYFGKAINVAQSYMPGEFNVRSVKTNLVGMFSKMAKATGNELAKMNAAVEKTIADVYVGDEPTPRLTAVKMALGKYINSSDNTPVKCPADIKGEVRDETGQVAISGEETDNLRVFSKAFGGFKKFLTKRRSIGGMLWHYQTKIAPKWAAWNLKMLWKATSPLRWLAKKTIGAVGKAALGFFGLSMPNQDLYSKRTGEVSIVGRLIAAGEYIDVNTQKVIRKISDISGAVINRNNQQVISEEEAKEGLLTASGESVAFTKVKDFLTKRRSVGGLLWKYQTKVAPKLAAANLRMLGKAARSMLPASLKAGASAGAAVANEFNPLAKGSDAEKSERKLKNWTPSMMGSRIKGSFDQIKKRFGLSRDEVEGMEQRSLLSDIREALVPKKVRKGSAEDIDAHRPGKAKTDAGGDAKREAAQKKAANSSFGDLFGINKIKDAIGSIVDGVGLAKDVAKGGGKLLKGGGSLLGKLFTAGRTALGLGGAAQLVTGTAAAAEGAAAAGAATAGAGAAAGGGLLATIGGGLMTGAGMLATFLTSPVVIGAAAAALAAYGSYRLYKHFTKGKVSALSKLRLVQYGYKATDEKHYVHALDLESALKSAIRFSERGAASLDYKAVKMKALMEPFGLNADDAEQRTLFLEWFKKRFEPVFCTHMTAAKAVNKDASDLSVVEGLKGEPKQKYFDAVKMPNGPYDFRRMPYLPKEKVEVSDSRDVQAAIEAVTKEAKDNAKEKGKSLVVPAAVAAVAPAAAALLPQNSKGISVNALKQSKDAGESKSVMVAGAATVSALTMADGSKLSALDAVRFKAYGLVELQPDKVKSLQILEQALIKDLAFTGQSAASWNGNAVKLLEGLSSSYGISDVFSEQAHTWFSWFNDRFLPVFLNYITAFKVRTGKTSVDPGSAALIKSTDQYEIAKIIVGTKGVWDVKDSPWDKYVLSADVKVVQENLNYLQAAAEKAKLDEQASKEPPKQNQGGANTPTKIAPQSDKIGKLGFNRNTLPSAPDAEGKNITGGKGGATTVDPQADVGSGGGSISGLKQAAGPLADGRNAGSFLKLAGGVSLDSVNASFKKQFFGAVEEYGQLTGKSVTITDGFRSYQDQVRMQQKYGSRAAAPGTSLHEFGLAMDVDSKALDEMDKLGLLRKYGLTRPVGQEPWHLEPIGIQMNIPKYKTDAQAATTAIESGIGKGGGGMGTMADARKYGRSLELSQQIYNAAVNATDMAKAGDDQKPSDAAKAYTAATGKLGFAPKTAVASNDKQFVSPSRAGEMAQTNANNMASMRRATNVGPSDAEGKVGTPGTSTPINIAQGDPTAKIPDPTGPGIDGMRNTISGVAKATGVDENLLMNAVAIESDFKPNAAAGTSSAKGVMQFTAGTWRETLKKYGSKYGYDQNTPPTDVKASLLMGAHYFKDNLKSLSGKINRPIGVVEAYFSHFLGPGGAATFFKGLDSNPNDVAAQAMPDAAKANSSIFYAGGRARTFGEVYQEVANRLQKKAKQYGLSIDIGKTGTSGPATIPTAAGSSNGTSSAYMPTPTKEVVSPSARPGRSMPTASAPSYGGGTSAAYGMSSPPQAAMSSAPSADMFKPVVDIASKQLDALTQISGTLQEIFGLMKSNGSNGATPAANDSTTAPPATYAPPKAAVPMTRFSA